MCRWSAQARRAHELIKYLIFFSLSKLKENVTELLIIVRTNLGQIDNMKIERLFLLNDF